MAMWLCRALTHMGFTPARSNAMETWGMSWNREGQGQLALHLLAVPHTFRLQQPPALLENNSIAVIGSDGRERRGR